MIKGESLFRIPWTYVPGNHDDDDAPWSRNDLLEIYELPGCVAKGAKSFNHTVTVGSAQGAEIGGWICEKGWQYRVLESLRGLVYMYVLYIVLKSCNLQLGPLDN